jgi:UDP-N-acetylglucosamine 2-epimerase (non-hydrolysing)
MKVHLIVGARPNFMKAAPIIDAAKPHKEKISCYLIHTGQHYDAVMSKLFFDDLGLPKPDIYLGIGSGTHAEQSAGVMVELEKIFMREKPDMVVVVGDVNSTMAGALAASKLCIPVAHIEAGLRSFDREMPEEINRLVTDSISDYLFTTCQEADTNLLREGHSADRIFMVGNVMIDSLLKSQKASDASRVLDNLFLQHNGSVSEYSVLTLHRPSNVDDRDTLLEIFEALRILAKDSIMIFPVHPRTRKQIESFGLTSLFNVLDADMTSVRQWNKPVFGKINCTMPLGYLDFIKLLSRARLVLTDSGGIQEETTIMKVPCLTLRHNTERAITVYEGTNLLVGNNKQKIIEGAHIQLKKDFSGIQAPKYWDGGASGRIIKTLLNTL